MQCNVMETAVGSFAYSQVHLKSGFHINLNYEPSRLYYSYNVSYYV